MAEEKKKKKPRENKDCGCNDPKCHCGDDCSCTPEDNCGCGGHCHEEVNYLELAQRIQADFENYKRRNRDVIKESFQNGVAVTVEKLLPVMDSFKEAKKNITDEKVLEGVNMIYNQLDTALKDLGVTKIDCVGKPFDPNFHNAVMVAEDEEKEDNVVLDEFQEGFILNDKVIRHSVVRINKLNHKKEEK